MAEDPAYFEMLEQDLVHTAENRRKPKNELDANIQCFIECHAS